MHTCSIHVTTYALQHENLLLWKPGGSLGSARLFRCRALGLHPTTRRGPGSPSSASPGLPAAWHQRVAAASPGVLCRLPAARDHRARGFDPRGEGWTRPWGHGLGPTRVLRVIRRLVWLGAGIKPLPPSWKAPLTSPLDQQVTRVIMLWATDWCWFRPLLLPSAWRMCNRIFFYI